MTQPLWTIKIQRERKKKVFFDVKKIMTQNKCPALISVLKRDVFLCFVILVAMASFS